MFGPDSVEFSPKTGAHLNLSTRTKKERTQNQNNSKLGSQPKSKKLKKVKNNEDDNNQQNETMESSPHTTDTDVDTITPSHLITQVIDSLCYEIILKPDERTSKFETFQYYLRMVDHCSMTKFGRLHCSVMLANLILKLNRHDDVVSDLEFWDLNDWEEYISELKAVRNMLLRKDATIFIPAPILGFNEYNDDNDNNNDKDDNERQGMNFKDERTNERLDAMDLFSSKFETIIKMCFLHSALSYIRLDIEDVMNATKGTSLNVSTVHVRAMYKYIQNNFSKDEEYYGHLTSLFSSSYKLSNVKKIYEVMTRSILSLDRFRKVTERLLQNWYIKIFPEPVLVSIGYTKSFYNNNTSSSDVGYVNNHVSSSFTEVENRNITKTPTDTARSITAEADAEYNKVVEDKSQNDEGDNGIQIESNQKRDTVLSEKEREPTDDDATVQYDVNSDNNEDGDTSDEEIEVDENEEAKKEVRKPAKVNFFEPVEIEGKRKRQKTRTYHDEFLPQIEDLCVDRLSTSRPDSDEEEITADGIFVPSRGAKEGDDTSSCGHRVQEEPKNEKQKVSVYKSPRRQNKSNNTVAIDEEEESPQNPDEEEKESDSVAFNAEEVQPFDPEKESKKARTKARTRARAVLTRPRTPESIGEPPDNSQSSNESSQKDTFHSTSSLKLFSSPRKKRFQIASSSSSSENDDDDDDFHMKSRRLATPPPKVNVATGASVATNDNQTNNDGDNDNDNQPTRKRVPWSEEEEDAVREGYWTYGNQWVVIKEEYPDVLAHRTNVNIKDKVRTMKKRKEL